MRSIGDSLHAAASVSFAVCKDSMFPERVHVAVLISSHFSLGDQGRASSVAPLHLPRFAIVAFRDSCDSALLLRINARCKTMQSNDDEAVWMTNTLSSVSARDERAGKSRRGGEDGETAVRDCASPFRLKKTRGSAHDCCFLSALVALRKCPLSLSRAGRGFLFFSTRRESARQSRRSAYTIR